MVTAAPFGLQLDGGLQRDVPPFRSSYQTSAYFAALQAVQFVTCRQADSQQSAAAPCTSGYHVELTPEDRIYDAGSHPRIFEVGRNGAVDLSVVDKEGVRTIHPLRPDLDYTAELGVLKQGVGFDNTAVAATLIVVLLIAGIVTWTNQRMWAWVARHPGLLAILAVIGVAAFASFVAFGGVAALLADHDAGEPFSWTAGVSVWPSELLRIVVVILSLIMLGKGLRDLAKNSDAISRSFCSRMSRAAADSHPTPSGPICNGSTIPPFLKPQPLWIRPGPGIGRPASRRSEQREPSSSSCSISPLCRRWNIGSSTRT